MNFVLWRRPNAGQRAPSLTKLVGHKGLNEYDRKMKLGQPIELPPEHEELSLDQLAKLYPAPPYKDNVSEA